MDHISLDIGPILLAVVGFIAWLSRLENKTKQNCVNQRDDRRDINGLGKKISIVENEIFQELKKIEITLARLEEKMNGFGPKTH